MIVKARSGTVSLEIKSILKEMINRGASDLHLKVASPPILRINGSLDMMEVLMAGGKPIELRFQGNDLEQLSAAARASVAWLERMDRRKAEIMPLFQKTYGKEAEKFWHYWRIFFLACSELFRYRKGTEWIVLHTLFRKKQGL